LKRCGEGNWRKDQKRVPELQNPDTRGEVVHLPIAGRTEPAKTFLNIGEIQNEPS
jgi:hypothetical protein